MFMPLLVKRLGVRKTAGYLGLVGSTLLVLFLPFLNAQAIWNFLSGLGVYFRKFEFNAGIYYFIRWIGYQVTGYNIIGVAGVVLSITAVGIIATIALRERKPAWESLPQAMLLCTTAYFLLATTVHPWYLTTLVMLSALSTYRYPVVWSLLAVVSYAAYQFQPVTENLWLITMEYLVVLAWMAYELLPWRARQAEA